VQDKIIFSQVDIKKLYRFFLLRQHLHDTVGTSGLYCTAELHKAAKAIGINYNTIKRDIKFFSSNGIVIKSRAHFKLNRLESDFKRVYRLWLRFKVEAANDNNPAVYFSDLYKRNIIHRNIICQAYKEAEKIQDPGQRSKYLKIVKGSKTPIGARQGIYLSTGTIGRLLGRCRATAHKYMSRINDSGIIIVQKNYKRVCDASQLEFARRAENLYGRLFIRNGNVYERLQNSYLFN
jgi:hypothetical protein